MFDIGFSEFMVIGVVALIVIGPERLPKVAKTVGHLLGRAQRYVNNIKADIHREIEIDELRKLQSDMQTAARQVQSSVTTGMQQVETDIHATVREIKPQPVIIHHIPGDPPSASAPLSARQTSAQSSQAVPSAQPAHIASMIKSAEPSPTEQPLPSSQV